MYPVGALPTKKARYYLKMDNAGPDEKYSRQSLLPGFGEEGRFALRSARVLVAGVGGLGAPVVQYLCAAGIGDLTIVDDDRVEASNLNRQVLFGDADVGRQKVKVAEEWVRSFHPSVKLTPVGQRLTASNAADLIHGQSLVIDCTDSLPAKYMLNDTCVRRGVSLVHGAVSRYDGRVLFVPAAGRPCLRCIFPELPPAGTVGTCRDVGVLGASVGIVGSAMAQIALRFLVGQDPQAGVLHALSLATLQNHQLNAKRDPDCPACGDTPSVDGTDPEDYRVHNAI